MANYIESMPAYYDQSIAGELAYKDYQQKVAMTRDITDAITRNAESINSRIVDAQIATTTAMYNNTQQLDGTLKAGFSNVSRQIGEMSATMSMGFAALNSAVWQSAQAICDRLDTMNDILNNPSLTKTRELYRRAAVNYDKGFYDEAKNDLLEALASNKTDYISWFLLGKTYLFGAGEFSNVIDLDAAVDALKNAVKYITPDARKQDEARVMAAEMCFYLGLAQQTRAMDALHAKNEADCRGYLEQAGSSYSQSWDYSAQMLEARYNRARCKALLGDTPGAIADLEALVLADRNYCIKVCADNDFVGIAAEFAALIKKLKNAAFIPAQKNCERLKTLLAELAALGGKTDATAPAFTGELPYFDVLDYAKDFKRNIPIVEKAVADRKAAIADTNAVGQLLKLRERIAQYQVCIAAGGSHTVGLKTDGRVVAVGENKDGQCNVSGWREIVAVSAGGSHTVGLKSDGTVVAIGNNKDGQCNTRGWSNIVAVSAGGSHTVGLKSDGTVVAVGSGAYGTDNWRNIVAVSAGGSIIGLKSNGTVVSNKGGNNKSEEIDNWCDLVAVQSGYNDIVGLKIDGTVITTGNHCGDTYDWNDIVAVSGGYKSAIGLKVDGTVITNGWYDTQDWRDIVAVSAIHDHAVGLKADGTVVAVNDIGDFGQCNVSGWRGIGPVSKWQIQGKCAYCGGELGGLFTKKCKDCGKEKNY